MPAEPPHMAQHTIESPLGPIVIRATPRGLVAVRIGDTPPPPSHEAAATAILEEAVAQLEAYFAGQRRTFDLPIDWQTLDLSSFQRRVLETVQRVPWGSTTHYATLAKTIGRPGGAQAVGQALAHNPVLIVIPCHRVVGPRNELRGYAGGIEAKIWLLRHEGVLLG